MSKLKIFPLMISKTFMHDHPRKSEQTDFMPKILLNFNKVVVEEEDGKQSPSNNSYSAKMCAAIVREFGFKPKLHTFRENYDFWKARVEKINAGIAVLSLRQWSGSPYNYKRDGSKPIEFIQLQKVGIQHASIDKEYGMIRIDDRVIPIDDHGLVAQNDGLSQQDFYDWFKLGRKSFDGCIIHFTDYRY